MLSFVKEFDKPTLEWVRYLAENEKRIIKRHPRLTLLVVWVGGDQKTLARWAKKHKIADLPMGVIQAKDQRLRYWTINPKVKSTTVLLERTMPVANLIDLKASDASLFEKQLENHFQKPGK